MKRQSAYGTVGIAVGPVEKLDDPEAAFVYVEMDIPLFKIRCDQAPDFCPGVSPLYLLPDLESESPAVHFGIDIEKFQPVVLRPAVNPDDRPSGSPAIRIYGEGLALRIV